MFKLIKQRCCSQYSLCRVCRHLCPWCFSTEAVPSRPHTLGIWDFGRDRLLLRRGLEAQYSWMLPDLWESPWLGSCSPKEMLSHAWPLPGPGLQGGQETALCSQTPVLSLHITEFNPVRGKRGSECERKASFFSWYYPCKFRCGCTLCTVWLTQSSSPSPHFLFIYFFFFVCFFFCCCCSAKLNFEIERF